MRNDSNPSQNYCEYCGAPIPDTHTNLVPREFCSRSCANKGRAKPIDVRLWSKVNKGGGADSCWEWQGGKNIWGYGVIKFGDKQVGAHRVAWILTNGGIPDGLLVCHHCDNPGCVNPAHMFLGTNKDNTADKFRKGRGADVAGERNPCAKLTAEQVRDARRRHAAGGITFKSLADELGVKRQTIEDAVNGRNWKHLK